MGQYNSRHVIKHVTLKLSVIFYQRKNITFYEKDFELIEN